MPTGGNSCERSAFARAAHIASSPHRWVYQFCELDEPEKGGLVSHKAVAHCYCRSCQSTFADYREHRIQSHYRCRKCHDEFKDANGLSMVKPTSIGLQDYHQMGLYQHQQTHLPRTKECYGCPRNFATDSAILIHLKSGACACSITYDDIDTWAFECYQHQHYTNEWIADYHSRWPACESDFEFVSGLFQRIHCQLKQYFINQVARVEGSETS